MRRAQKAKQYELPEDAADLSVVFTVLYICSGKAENITKHIKRESERGGGVSSELSFP